MKKNLQLKISGKVQGVWYRGSTKAKAEELGLCGLVRNEPDGSVLVEVEGSKEGIDELISWCWQGPPLARVKLIDICELPLKNYSSFLIQR